MQRAPLLRWHKWGAFFFFLFYHPRLRLPPHLPRPQLYRELAYDGLRAGVIHAGLSQARREAAVEAFRAGSVWVLIATDLLGRGIDFKGVATVVNFDFPRSTAAYIHRVGRAGRAGLPGSAVTLFSEDDSPQLRAVAQVIRASGGDVPAWMLALKKVRNRNRRRPRPGQEGQEEGGGEEAATERAAGGGDADGGDGGALDGSSREAGKRRGRGAGGAKSAKASLSTEPLRKRERRAEISGASKRRMTRLQEGSPGDDM